MKNVKKITFKFLQAMFFVVLVLILFRNHCFAATGDVNLSANVISQVSPELSSASSSVESTLADPAGHSILINVVLLDKNQQPLPNKLITLFSSRGTADIIEATSKLLKLQNSSIAESDYSDMQKDYTDNNGVVTFRLTSFTSGSAAINVVADGIVKLKTIKANFEPLPYSMYMTVAVKFPAVDKEITLLSSEYNKNGLTDLQKQQLALNKPGAKIYVPGWIFIIFCLIVIFLAILLIVVTTNRIMIGKIKEEETDILKKIAESKDGASLK